MKKVLILLSMMFALGTTTFAMPAKQGKKVIKLADGTQVTAELKGDEFLNWWETSDGKKYVESGDNAGVYVAANFGEMQKAAAQLRASAEQSRALRAARPGNLGAWPSRISADHNKYKGQKKGLIILVEFKNDKFASGHDHDYYENLANTLNFTHKDGYVGSVRDYFLAQSNGEFDLMFDVMGPVQMTHNTSYYGNDVSQGYYTKNDAKVGDMIKEACDGVADQVNFADYDWDGDGEADQVFVLYAGLSQAAGGGKETIWPHEWEMKNTNVGKVLTYSTGKVNTYACSSELEKEINQNTGQFTNNKKVSGIGTICHEFSHCMGLPDMYDTQDQSQNYGTQFYDLMSAGSYLGDGFVPCNYTAYERIVAGWVDPIELSDPATIKDMASSTDYGRPFIMYNDKHPNEFYTIENRQKTGWDSALYGHGLMITHVDYDKTVWDTNSVNSSAHDHPHCALILADNSTQYTAFDVAGDLYPFYDEKGRLRNNALTDDTTPASTLYSRNTDGTKYMHKPITEIEENEDGTMNFLVNDGDENNIISNATETAIGSVKADTKTSDSRVYTIDGRYMGQNANGLGKGIYIVGGKKIVK